MAKKSSAASRTVGHGHHERAESDRLKTRGLTSVASTLHSETDEVGKNL